MMKMNMFKKLLLGFLASIILFASVAPYISPVRAQPSTWYSQPYSEWYQKVYDEDNPEEIFGERYAAAQVEWVVYGFFSLVLKTILGPDLTLCLIKPRVFSLFPALMAEVLLDCGDEILAAAVGLITSDTNTAPRGFLATITTRPISGMEYFRDIAERLDLVPEAKAQGFGFEVARPMLELWRFVRNTTYFLLIFIIIVMAFMIMFRVRISPQTVISVQSALPKVIIALLLITFSYAIAGFMIDLMYVVMGLLAGILSSSPITDFSWTEMYTALTQRGVLELMFSYLFLFGLMLYPAMLSGGIIPAFLAVTIILPILITLLVIVILLIATFRILFLMLRTYVMIMLYIIIGPVMILFGTIGPGGFGSWLRGLLAQLAVYPTVAFMFFIAFVFLRGAFPSPPYPLIPPVLEEQLNKLITELFTFNISPVIGGSPPWNAPFTLGDVRSQELLWLFVSLAVILLIPNVANIIRGMLERRPFAAGTAIGQAVGPIAMMPVGFARGGVAQYAGKVAEHMEKGDEAALRGSRIVRGIESIARGRR